MSFLEEKDFGDYSIEYSEKCILDIDDCRIANDSPILINYSLIDLETSNYSFSQKFTQKDTQEYFSNMAYFSGRTINQIIDEKDHNLHFYRTAISGKLYESLKKIWPKRHIDRENTIIYHFALYTDKEKTSRKENIRSPRIYFVLGKEGVIYPLFFDPFHEINP